VGEIVLYTFQVVILYSTQVTSVGGLVLFHFIDLFVSLPFYLDWWSNMLANVISIFFSYSLEQL
jgi:hypothetical protein